MSKKVLDPLAMPLPAAAHGNNIPDEFHTQLAPPQVSGREVEMRKEIAEIVEPTLQGVPMDCLNIVNEAHICLANLNLLMAVFGHHGGGGGGGGGRHTSSGPPDQDHEHQGLLGRVDLERVCGMLREFRMGTQSVLCQLQDSGDT